MRKVKIKLHTLNFSPVSGLIKFQRNLSAKKISSVKGWRAKGRHVSFSLNVLKEKVCKHKHVCPLFKSETAYTVQEQIGQIGFVMPGETGTVNTWFMCQGSSLKLIS